jgi:hypothetical protein
VAVTVSAAQLIRRAAGCRRRVLQPAPADDAFAGAAFDAAGYVNAARLLERALA